jgi:hypothetical protein
MWRRLSPGESSPAKEGRRIQLRIGNAVCGNPHLPDDGRHAEFGFQLIADCLWLNRESLWLTVVFVPFRLRRCARFGMIQMDMDSDGVV